MIQDPRLDEWLKQEEEIQFIRFTNSMALELGLKLVEAAGKNGKPVAVAITKNRQSIFQYAMDGTYIDNADWIRRKTNVVDRFGHSSQYMKTLLEIFGVEYEVFGVSPIDYAKADGAFPLNIKGVGVVGSIILSGLPQGEDHALLVQVLREYLAEQETGR